MPITLYATGETHLKQSSSYLIVSQFATILFVIWSANGDGSALTSKASSNLINDDLTDAFVRLIVSSIQTNRARCTLYKKIHDFLDEESTSGESSDRVSL